MPELTNQCKWCLKTVRKDSTAFVLDDANLYCNVKHRNLSITRKVFHQLNEDGLIPTHSIIELLEILESEK